MCQSRFFSSHPHSGLSSPSRPPARPVPARPPPPPPAPLFGWRGACGRVAALWRVGPCGRRAAHGARRAPPPRAQNTYDRTATGATAHTTMNRDSSQTRAGSAHTHTSQTGTLQRSGSITRCLGPLSHLSGPDHRHVRSILRRHDGRPTRCARRFTLRYTHVNRYLNGRSGGRCRGHSGRDTLANKISHELVVLRPVGYCGAPHAI